MIDKLTKIIAKPIFSAINRINQQLIGLIRKIIKRIEELGEETTENSADIEAIYVRLDEIEKILAELLAAREIQLDDVVQGVADEVVLDLPDDLANGIIFTNGDVVPEGAVVPEGNITLEGMPIGDSTETLAKASVNPAPKTIEIQDSIDKTL